MDHLRHAKMWYRLVLLLLSVAWGFPAVSHGQSYVVVSLDTLRAHTTYGVVVANIAPKTQHFRFEIVANNQSIARTSAVDIAANGLKQIDLNINQLDPDALHMLQVWDASKGVLLNATSVACSARSYVVLFQTDKPVYKAGDKILFRVVFMTLDLMPVQEAGITIFLTDPLGSRLKQWSSAPLQNGVFEGKFQLAPEPSFGRWTINANINEQTYRETVQVEEYSVPLFNTGLKIIVRFQLQAQHTLNISATRVDDTPQKYSISIGAGNDAYVGLFGVEERTRIMSSGENDLSWKKLHRALQPFNEQHADEFLHDSFKRVGALLLTDGYEPDVGPVLNAQGRVGSIFAEDEAPREHYPETWIWESVRTLDQRIQTIERTLPNIGTYYLMAFALDSTYGLQITKPARLIFSKDIFAQLHIPPSLNRSDEAIGHCLIHNYGASVTVFVEVQPNLVNTKLVLGAGETESIPLKLLFEQVGDVKIIVTLRISNGSIIDTVQQKISVRQRGIVQFVEDVRLIHFPKMSQTELNLSVELPKQNIIPDSGKLTLSVIGSFPNLHEYDLLPMAGSSHMNGSTNVLFFQTALTIYEYLRNSGLLKADSLAKFSPLVEVALQNQLKFRMKSGAFSFLGYDVYDRCGSVWLTAKTVDSFIKATEFVHINDRNIEASLNWLQEQMLPNGSFKEACSSELDRAQINGEYELSLATTVLTSFINNKYSSKYSNLLNRTLTMLLKAPMDDVYIIARIAHLLTLMKHPSRFTVIEQLNKQVIDVDGAFRYWLERKHPNDEPSQRDTETTAYALLANINEGTMASENIKRVAQWLYKRCFSANRFIVTAENLIGLQALGEVAKRIVVSETNISITLPSMQNIVVNEINRDLLQTLPLTRATPRAMVSVTGLGSAWVKLSYKYNVA
ncbi:hypothetical protein AND_009520 [Anopheles darlingi]|uniref:TEP1-F n=1 Tax=Anopheles darlingi TaxID=43151 RepID=W5J7Q2_ANODA|nr:hypothetical protein AND_009520 [Anopheles darlingi]